LRRRYDTRVKGYTFTCVCLSGSNFLCCNTLDRDPLTQGVTTQGS
jgi:hypothetical protein